MNKNYLTAISHPLVAVLFFTLSIDVYALKRNGDAPHIKAKENNPISNVDEEWEKKADLNQDGKIGAGEFKQAQKNRKKHLAEKSKVDEEWEKRSDLNQDGQIGAEEYAQAQKNRRKFLEERSKVDEEWEKLADTNGDGVISKDEAMTYRASASP